ncbi:MAG: hypothetical protein LBD42_00240 [Desulfovibrio sp.]|nr:hypothetical protein [Desulfovibrio sp.]
MIKGFIAKKDAMITGYQNNITGQQINNTGQAFSLSQCEGGKKLRQSGGILFCGRLFYKK